MYKLLSINGKEYKLEYSVEAALYGDCVSKISKLMLGMNFAEEKNDLRIMLDGFSDIPEIAVTVFYAGLIEAHGTHPDGDGSVPDIYTAKKLAFEYIKENKDNENGSFYGIMRMCIDQMGEDGFFKLVGLNDMLEVTAEEKNQTKKKNTTQNSKKVSEK